MLIEPRPVEDAIATADGLVVTSSQHLSKDFWDNLADAKEDFRLRLDGYTPVATIPEGLVNKWLREGFDFYHAPANEIIRKLHIEEYSAFIISGDTRFDH